MSTSTYEGGPSRVELDLLMRAAVRAATPTEEGRAQADRLTGRLLSGLGLLAGSIALYDVGVFLRGGG